MPAPEVIEALKVRFAAEPFSEGASVAPEHLVEAARALRDTHGYRYYLLASAAERADGFEVVHGLRNPATLDTLFLKTKVAKEGAEVASLALVWAGAEWHEREVFDLFGIGFPGHPDLRRILLPDEYEGYPLRKDFAMDRPWGYRPATRDGAAG